MIGDFIMLDDVIDFCSAGIIGIFSWFLGGRDGFVNVLVTFVIIDYITGVMVAYSKHRLNSSVGFKGISRKVSIFFLVGVAHVVDVYLLNAATLRTPVAVFYAANEGLSIIENAHALGLPIPLFLKSRLFNIKKLSTEETHKKKQH